MLVATQKSAVWLLLAKRHWPRVRRLWLSGTQALPSSMQALTSGTQALPSSTQALASGTQALASSTQALASSHGANRHGVPA